MYIVYRDVIIIYGDYIITSVPLVLLHHLFFLGSNTTAMAKKSGGSGKNVVKPRGPSSDS
ncbi:hypothetical protein BVRB_8g183780 [Beta vulgaris subsp. vulgaris]|nr:hypothetical protein BVRB_8g183780 [Beta vulgaris subsp. vulgaris]